MDLEKLAQEKTEMQRHYVMVSIYRFSCYCYPLIILWLEYIPFYIIGEPLNNGIILCLLIQQYYEMSYGLNVEMHKQVNKMVSVCAHGLRIEIVTTVQISHFNALQTIIFIIIAVYLHNKWPPSFLIIIIIDVYNFCLLIAFI